MKEYRPSKLVQAASTDVEHPHPPATLLHLLSKGCIREN